MQSEALTRQLRLSRRTVDKLVGLDGIITLTSKKQRLAGSRGDHRRSRLWWLKLITCSRAAISSVACSRCGRYRLDNLTVRHGANVPVRIIVPELTARLHATGLRGADGTVRHSVSRPA